MDSQTISHDNLLTPAEVAHLFRVDPKTVSRWAEVGKLSSVRTLGGHRRFKEAEVQRLRARGTEPISDDPTR